MAATSPYRGRFAPSPTGPLHAGSLVAALASWLDARAHTRGQWLLRLEDVDTPRTVPGSDRIILDQLARCGLVPDAPPLWQSQRGDHYQHALQRLVSDRWSYPCTCTRLQIDQALNAQGGGARPRHTERIYPGTCRPAPNHLAKSGTESPPNHRTDRPSAWRFRVDSSAQFSEANRAVEHTEYTHTATQSIAKLISNWVDRRLGAQQQDLARSVGDFVLKRADGCFTYQLAVVVDDALQDITHIVRGEDLADNTARQIALQRALGWPTPRYLHTPLVRAANGEKLSKQNGAQALDVQGPQQALAALNAAAQRLGLPAQNAGVSEALAAWVSAWKVMWAIG